MANLQFWRSREKSDTSFLDLIKRTFGKTFTTGLEAKTWLITNGYYTSYPDIVTDGLVLSLDASNSSSFKGEPTTNYVYRNNPRIDSRYTSDTNFGGGSGTLIANHPNAILVYNQDGTDISNYINTGVGDWTNAQHAYWVFDNSLKKPVVVMIDKVGSWQAKSYHCGMSAWSTYGYGVGTQYTISWMQWVTHLDKRADVGMYVRSSGGVYDFHDGRSGASASSTNTKINTWERVYHTFTVTSNWDQTIEYNYIYMYGMSYINGETLKIADVQLEIKDHPTHFYNGLTRGTTYATGGGWCDISGNGNHGDLGSGITYSPTNGGVLVSDGTTNGYVQTPLNLSSSNFTVMGAARYSGGTRGRIITCNVNNWLLGHWGTRTEVFYSEGWVTSSSEGANDTNWRILCGTGNISGDNYEMYVNDVKTVNGNNGGSQGPNGLGFCIYHESSNAEIGILLAYNRVLTSSEVLQNYNALKERFGL